jgi:hypothetical protein
MSIDRSDFGYAAHRASACLQILCATGLNIVAPREKPAQQTYTGNVNKF